MLSKQPHQGSGMLSKASLANKNLSNQRTNSNTELTNAEEIGPRLSGRNVGTIKKQADPRNAGRAKRDLGQSLALLTGPTQSTESLALAPRNLDFSKSPSLAALGSAVPKPFMSNSKLKRDASKAEHKKGENKALADFKSQFQHPQPSALTPASLLEDVLRNFNINVISTEDTIQDSKPPDDIGHLLP